eukprot:CAMPEP_0177352756 /NCGR_PEP_ID=MMETSP0368-20130122/32520_1 /TAXON_ID=447022 ORGANISM="Scrippsiella hangoei-like, Strain SHHI-4" /NCGR_SAMPLE_ID=MMETSP0368 /ASSEMBLY_ACC=CAM_ASM_000363 /LENGTH=149 /DNA_ID=CAMNT_0018814759 /DNA_START=261 /DNA_END=707 /DNA_ORIENTATION=+
MQLSVALPQGGLPCVAIGSLLMIVDAVVATLVVVVVVSVVVVVIVVVVVLGVVVVVVRIVAAVALGCSWVAPGWPWLLGVSWAAPEWLLDGSWLACGSERDVRGCWTAALTKARTTEMTSIEKMTAIAGLIHARFELERAPSVPGSRAE